MAIDTKSVSQFIAEFSKLQAKDAITPESSGYILQRLADLLASARACVSHDFGTVLWRRDELMMFLMVDMLVVFLFPEMLNPYIITGQGERSAQQCAQQP